MEECYSNYSVLECELCDLQEGYLKPDPPTHLMVTSCFKQNKPVHQ